MAKYRTLIEDEQREHETIDDVIDTVENCTCFEVDSLDLEANLRLMDVGESLFLRDDCVIYITV